MIVFNLQCVRSHRFEGWFASHASFDEQMQRGLVECPVCASKHIEKMLSAPRINRGVALLERGAEVSRGSTQDALSGDGAPGDAFVQETPEQVLAQAVWLSLVRHVVENTEDVGSQFAEEARRIHYHEAPDRGIRGHTSAEEARLLAEEGIDVVSFPLPAAFKGPMQ